MSTSRISERARIGKNVVIGDFTIVHDNVEIGDDTVIDSHCVIGYPCALATDPVLRIGPGSLVRSHSVLYEGSTIGPELRAGHSVMIRENSIIGDNAQIGSKTEVQGDCVLGDFLRTHSDVQIAKGTRIGDFVRIYPEVLFLNDPFPPSDLQCGVTVGDFAILTARTHFFPGVTLGLSCFVASGSLVKDDVPDLTCVAGNPAKPFATVDRFVSFQHGLSYPWAKRFRGGYPERAHARMDARLEDVDRAIAALRAR